MMSFPDKVKRCARYPKDNKRRRLIMKSSVFVLVLMIIVSMISVSCAQPTQAPPVATEAPAQPAAPAATEAPVVTEAPAPVATAAPAASEAPAPPAEPVTREVWNYPLPKWETP